MYRECRFSCGVCGGMWLGSHVPAEQDHSGVFVKYHEIAYKFNRMVAYSGHLFHSSYIPREALLRMEDSYEVCLKRSAGEELGMSKAKKDGTMVVKKIREGLLSDWNTANPGREVKVGFYILEVNGKRGTYGQLKKALDVSADVCMQISERSPDVNLPTGRLTLQHFVSDPSMTMHAQRYSEVAGLQEIIQKLQSGETIVEVDQTTFRFLKDLTLAEVIPTQVLQQIKVIGNTMPNLQGEL